MPATVQFISAHGATVTTTETNVASGVLKFKRADNDTDDAADPIPKPTGSEVFSWRKSCRIKATVAPDGNISNLRFFTDAGSWGTGVTLYGHKKPVANYDQASSSDNTTKIVDDGGSAVSDAATFTSGSPLTVEAGTVLAATTGYGTQDLVELQLGVANTASRGLKGPRVLTYRWDES